MNIETLRELCLSLPGVTEDIKWENHLCFCVGEKIFLITGLDESPVTASFKVAAEDFEALSIREGFSPAPYLARYKWIWTRDISIMDQAEWKVHIRQAYELVKAKLPKKVRESLEENS